MLRIFGARGISLPNESAAPHVELSEKGTILVRVAFPSTHERDEYENAIKDGILNDSFRQLEVNLRDAFELPGLTLNASVSERRSENLKDTGNIH
ncbi:hypothetical protein DPMN_126172 [Dreissena polymorpha]|uniref:Uncharacterized protein n=1 Tax=Dreissena polymorpha TaxID=45954 RepID=A0A9D4GWT7_DREPO|nr:hypothetical protein DPMN_126172 [Dreissena polymorpha]